MFPRKGLYSMFLMTTIVLIGVTGPPAAAPGSTVNAADQPATPPAGVKSPAESLAMEAVNRFTTAVKASNDAKNNRDSANIELRAVADMTAMVNKLQGVAEQNPSLSTMAVMQGVIGLQSALVNYAIYDITQDEDILATGRRSAENAMRLLAASIQLSKQEQGGLPQGKNQL